MRLSLLFLLLLGTTVAEPRFEPIFNGRDLTGWSSPDMEKFWHVADGILVGENTPDLKGHYLWTEKIHGDFVLEFEVRWTGPVDTGVEMRQPKIQLQLGISGSLKRDMSGSLYTGKYPEAAQAKDAAKLMQPEGGWNTFRVSAKGPVFNVWINGTHAVVNYTDAKFTGPAPLGLQIHGNVKMKVEYRNIRLAAD